MEIRDLKHGKSGQIVGISLIGDRPAAGFRDLALSLREDVVTGLVEGSSEET